MGLHIDFIDETNELSEEDSDFVERLLKLCCGTRNIAEEDSEISVSFVTNDEIQEINKTYRGKDQPTDVISFALEEMGEGEIEISGLGRPRILGDIVISIEQAREQAEEYGHSFDRELRFSNSPWLPAFTWL